MKKIDLMLKLLFAVVFANGAFAQVGPYPGGETCATAVPITVGTGYETNTSCVPNDWYLFTAPCDGELTIDNCAYGPDNTKRIHSGVCGSLVMEESVSWSSCSTSGYAMTAGETAYIEIVDDWDCAYTFDVEFENPACPQPTSLSFFVSDYSTATLAWFGSGLESGFNVVYGPAGFDPLVEGTTVFTGTTSLMLTGLEELTCYEYYVQAICGGETSCFLSGPVEFCTPAICPAPLLPTEDDITNVSAVLNWLPGDSETQWEVNWGDEGFLIGDGTLDPITDDPTDTLLGLDPSTCYDWYVRAVCEVDLGDGPEFVNSLWVGPNEFCTNANCLDPSDGTMIASGGLSATLAWTENNTPPAEEWNIQYGAPGFTLGTGTTVTNIPSNPYTLGGLTPGTDYCYYVQAVCGETADSLSGWAGPFCFTTSIFCPEPNTLFATGTSGTEADLSWAPGDTETEWEISWGASPLADPATGTMESASVFPTLSLTGLTAGEAYCFYVRANCGDGADSASIWAGPYCWTQPADCETPFAMEVINITNTAAMVNFSSPGAESWEIEWGAPCFEGFAGEEIGSATTTEEPYYITGLDPSTPYWVYVRATCGVDSVSAITEPMLFGTDISNDDPCDAEELVLDGDAILRHNFEATTLAGEGALAPDASGCTDSDGWCSGDGVDQTVWFKFTAPPSGQVMVSTYDSSTCITNSYTEMAIYSTGACDILDNFVLEAANTLDEEAAEPGYGSTITACGLTPGQEYYVMVNPISYIQSDIHFSIALSSVEEVSAGLGLSPTICAGTTYDLFDAIAGYTEGGTWYNPSVAPGNELPSEVTFPDSEGSFDLYYVVDNGCDSDTVLTTVSTAAGVNAGGDGFYTACNDYPIILSDHLVGAYDGGGIWEYMGADPEVALAGGLFTTLGMSAGVYEFQYSVANEYCPTDYAVVTITLTDCMSIDENGADALVVYPNPVVDILTVQNVSIEGNAVIEVLDIEGRVVISNQVSNVFGNYTIDMNEIESGVYFVKVTTEDAVQKVRVVKQ